MVTTEDKHRLLLQTFPGIEPDDLDKFASVTQVRSYPAGEILCREGAVENTFYAIVSGYCEVIKDLDGEVNKVINRPGPGSFFGEIALVQESPRTATVQTVEPVTVLEVSRDDFIDMLHSSAPMAVRVMLLINARLREIDLTIIEHLQKKIVELEQRTAS